jgi:hypothetical protein
MADSTSNFYIKQNYNANFDITWSFQYAITGSNTATGGFSTFLFNNHILSGGGPYSGLGYTDYNSTNGVSGAVLGVLFFSDNTVKIIKGTGFNVLTSFNLPSSLSPLVKNTVIYNTIRCNFTNIGQTLIISIKDKTTDEYVSVGEFALNLSPKIDDFYKIGFSYSSPLTANGNKITFKLKAIQYQGIDYIPTTTISQKPIIVPAIETYYTLQSPSSSYIGIGIPDPTNTGFLLHKT